MERTQIYLGVEDVELLDREAERTGASRSELIRRAIQAQYSKPDVGTRRAALRASAGSWRSRRFTGAEYVDARRGDLNERLRKFGFD
jgi:hypothetical protein